MSPSPGLLFRLTVSEGGHVYITPISLPREQTKTFNPWNLRVKS